MTTRTNLIPNPSFEVDTTGWSRGTRSTAAAAVGSACLAIDSNGWVDSPSIAVTPGLTYQGSFAVWSTQEGARAQPRLSFYNASGGFIDSVDGALVGPPDVWKRATVQAVAPPGAATGSRP